jgi:flagellar hook-length control protein FliK
MNAVQKIREIHTQNTVRNSTQPYPTGFSSNIRPIQPNMSSNSSNNSSSNSRQNNPMSGQMNNGIVFINLTVIVKFQTKKWLLKLQPICNT